MSVARSFVDRVKAHAKESGLGSAFMISYEHQSSGEIVDVFYVTVTSENRVNFKQAYHGNVSNNVVSADFVISWYNSYMEDGGTKVGYRRYYNYHNGDICNCCGSVVNTVDQEIMY
jgi:hypothetical protein